MQVLLEGEGLRTLNGLGLTTYSVSDLRDALNLAQKLVMNYGLSDSGLTMYAPVGGRIGFMRRSFEVRPLPAAHAARDSRSSKSVVPLACIASSS